MNGIVHSQTKFGLIAFAVSATLVFTLTWSTPGAKASSAPSCATAVDHAKGALASGGTVSTTQVTTLRRCVLSQPGQTADALGLGQADGATTPATEADATVVASFWFSLPFCLEFKSDGTINPRPLVPIVVGVSGAYLGTPGGFTLFSLTIGESGSGGIQLVGVGIGPILLAVAIALPGVPVPPLAFGFQVANC
jgi:hypothetical protein